MPILLIIENNGYLCIHYEAELRYKGKDRK